MPIHEQASVLTSELSALARDQLGMQTARAGTLVAGALGVMAIDAALGIFVIDTGGAGGLWLKACVDWRCDTMQCMPVTTREELMRVVLDLPDDELDDALHLIDKRDPLVRRLDRAPLEDEEISPEEEAAVQEARDEIASGTPLISHEEIKREFGIA